MNSIIVDDKSNEYVEVEENDVLTTDSSNASDFTANKTKSTLNHLNKNNNKVKEDEDTEVNVEENSRDNDDEDVVVSKEKYDREKLLKNQLLNGNVNASTSKQANNSNLDDLNKVKKNSQPTQTRYETLDAEKKGKHLKFVFFLYNFKFKLICN